MSENSIEYSVLTLKSCNTTHATNKKQLATFFLSKFWFLKYFYLVGYFMSLTMNLFITFTLKKFLFLYSFHRVTKFTKTLISDDYVVHRELSMKENCLIRKI